MSRKYKIKGIYELTIVAIQIYILSAKNLKKGELIQSYFIIIGLYLNKMNLKKILPNLLLVFSFIATFLVNMQIGLFGDDYYYATFIKDDFWGLHKNHYLTINGRAIVHFLDTIFLSLPNIVWAVANSLMLTFITHLAGKIISLFSNEKSNYLKTILIFSFGILMLHISVIRQSVYWTTGSFNYVYPIFMLFWYLYALFKAFKNNFEGKQFFLILLALLASATVEQASMMVFGSTLLLLVYLLIRNKKLKENNNLKKLVFILLATFIGLSSVILAPGQITRIGLEENESISLIENAKNCILFLIKTFATVYLPQVALAIVLLLLFLIFYKKIRKLNFDEIYLLITSIILGVGSQAMMLVSPVFGERNTLFGIFMVFLFSAIFFAKIEISKNKIIKNISYSLIILLMIIAYGNIFKTFVNYKISNDIQNKNIAIINDYKLSKKEQNSINLYKLKNDAYGWSMPYVSKYHEYYFKLFYEIPNIEINWIE